MAMATAPHIKRDDRGVAWEEIYFQHPGLSLAQIYAALTYYYDNQAELDTEIARRASRFTSLARSLIVSGALLNRISPAISG